MKVIKRDNSLEDFNPEKIKKVAVAAGLEKDKAEKVVERVNSWIQSTGESEVSSLMIRDKVLELLKTEDEYAAGLYEWYEKTKDR